MGKKEQLQQNLNDCHRLLSMCSYMIQVMIKTVNRGEKADEICECLKITFSFTCRSILYCILILANYPNIMGFDPMVNQRLLPPTFPRYAKIKPRTEALKYLDELISRFRMVTMITIQNGFHAALVRNDLQVNSNFWHKYQVH